MMKKASENAATPEATVKPYYATRFFKDAGTTRFFNRGDELTDVSEGELGNYVASGLASTEPPKSPAEAEEAVLEETLG
jgi:hypothetical protein